MKELTSFQIAAVKRQYKNSKPTLEKITKKKAEVANLSKEIEELEKYLEASESGIKILTGGYTSIDLIKESYVLDTNPDGTPKMSKPDKNGKTYQLKKQILTYVTPVEVEEVNTEEVDTEAVVDMVETTNAFEGVIE